jgi:hypothetical protein
MARRKEDVALLMEESLHIAACGGDPTDRLASQHQRSAVQGVKCTRFAVCGVETVTSARDMFQRSLDQRNGAGDRGKGARGSSGLPFLAGAALPTIR